MKSKKENNMKIKDPLYFVSYRIYYDGDIYPLRQKFLPKWVRLLNIDQDELCETLKYIESWRDIKNSDGTLVVGRDLTILPSETMDEEMDVNDEFVRLNNNQLYYKPKNGEERPMTMKDYLYSGDNYIMMCWEYSKEKRLEKKKMKEESEVK